MRASCRLLSLLTSSRVDWLLLLMEEEGGGGGGRGKEGRVGGVGYRQAAPTSESMSSVAT